MLIFYFCIWCGVGVGWDGVGWDVNVQLKLLPVLTLRWWWGWVGVGWDGVGWDVNAQLKLLQSWCYGDMSESGSLKSDFCPKIRKVKCIRLPRLAHRRQAVNARGLWPGPRRPPWGHVVSTPALEQAQSSGAKGSRQTACACLPSWWQGQRKEGQLGLLQVLRSQGALVARTVMFLPACTTAGEAVQCTCCNLHVLAVLQRKETSQDEVQKKKGNEAVQRGQAGPEGVPG